ncbi:MAG: hypothetical protein JNG89_15070 [Planctomycetaceae bacterium]|nr:hypothetical protein [Planctomycetaceae bacterium]
MFPLDAFTLAYIGPETALPVASALAAAAGVVLTFWRYIRMLLSRCWRFVTRRAE